MKKGLALSILFVLAAAALTGCAADTNPDEQASFVDIFANNPDPVYKNVEFRDDYSVGSPESYDELQEFLNTERMNFFRFQILDVYTPEEAFEITASDVYTRNLTTLFKAKLTYDYIKDEAVDVEVNIAKAGVPQLQLEGSPLYGVGEEYAAYFTNMDLSKPRLVACSELLFALKNDGTQEFALHPEFSKIDFVTSEGNSLDLGIENGEVSVITTTSNNPIKYVHKYNIEQLAEFFREDWAARGYYFIDIEDQQTK